MEYLINIFSYFNFIILGAFVMGLAFVIINATKSITREFSYLSFFVVGIFTILAQRSYLVPHRSVFTNVNHHLIEHLGYSFNHSLELVNDRDPNKSLWDNKRGALKLDIEDSTFHLRGTDFFEPIYVRNNDNAILANNIVNQAITRSLAIIVDSIRVDVNLTQTEKSPYNFVLRNKDKEYGPFAIPLKSSIKVGYSLSAMLRQCQADAPNMNEVLAALDSVLLVRESISTAGEDESDSPLFFFPTASFLQSGAKLLIDGKEVTFVKKPLVNILLRNNQAFFLGVKTSKTPIYTASCVNKENGLCYFLTQFSDKKYLKNLSSDTERMFLTSSSEDVTKSEQLAGFYYPLLKSKDNQHHFSANLAYKEGRTDQRLHIRLINLDQNEFKRDDKNTSFFIAGDTISIESRGYNRNTSNNTSWLFKINDLKSSNPLQAWHIFLFTLWIVCCIFVSIYLNKSEAKSTTNKQTKQEYIIYLIVLFLLSIRSVLLWRMSTFLPTEDISPKVFNSLREGGFHFFQNGVWATTIFFLLIWIWKFKKNSFQKNNLNKGLPSYFFTFSTSLTTNSSGRFAALLLLYIIPFSIRQVPFLERLGAVFIPIVIYFFISFTLMYGVLERNASIVFDKRYKMLALVNWIACFCYLASSDAGFSIVFFLSTLIFWFIRSATFKDYQQRNDNSSNPLLKNYGILEFVLPAICILLFIFFTPNVMDFIFNKTIITVIICAVLIIGVSIYSWFTPSLMPDFNGKKYHRVTSIALVIVAVLCLTFRGTIAEKIQTKGYIRYRAEVLIKTPDEIIKDETFKFNLGNDSKLLRAALNQWIISYFYEKGKEGSVCWGLLPNLNNYFRILPSFERGSPYLTQISDLVTVRYVIAEHSQWLLVQVLILMIFLIVACIDKDNRLNIFSKLTVHLACLLFALSFFIWLAATNKMVFLGQDFPLLSMNSLLTLAFTFSLLFCMIILSDTANQQEKNSTIFNRTGRVITNKYLRVLIPICLFMLVYFREHKFSPIQFDLEQTIHNLQSDFISLNNEFEAFQLNNPSQNDSVESLVKQFDTSLGSNKKALFKTDFAASAYDAYLNVLSKNNDPANLIHLRRGTDGFYKFSINKLFYTIQSPDVQINAWKGHITTQEDNNTFSFLNRESNQSITINPSQSDGNLQNTLGSLINQRQNNNIRLTQLPLGWGKDNVPIIIISQTKGQQRENKSNFIVKSGADIFKSGSNQYAFILKPNDVLQFIPAENRTPVTLQFQHQPMLYLAKNVWLNGRFQFFYPLEHKFFWSYSFANLVKDKYANNTEQQFKDVVTTIDPTLTSDIYDQAENYFKANKWDLATENSRAFNLVVLGSDGGIRALCDYKKGNKIKINPNNFSRYKEVFEQQYLNQDTDQERLIFGNRCLLRSDNGPASTFKPLMYAAVTSQYNFNWSLLRFGGLGKTPYTKNANDGIVIHHFGDRKIKFTVDANQNILEHGNDTYISHSTNTYNSMIVFLGSLDKNQITEVKKYADGNQRLTTFLSASLPDTLFPNFSYNGKSLRVNQFPKSWSNNNSLIAHGLWENFGLPTTVEHLSGIEGKNLQNIAFDLDSLDFATTHSTNKFWSFPESSHLYLIDRNTTNSAIVQLATGADPINTTPLKMAEMAARLYSFNRSLKSSVLATHQQKYAPFKTDNTWGNKTNLTAFYGTSIMKGMHDAIVNGGTAQGIIGPVVTEFPAYHFYAKTGTISGGVAGKRDKHLLLIISKKQLDVTTLTPEMMKENKFFVLYFSFYKQSNSSEWDDAGNTLREMIRSVVKSKSFKTYMQ